MTVVCKTKVSLQLSATILIHFVASQQREKTHPSLPIPYTAQMVPIVDFSVSPISVQIDSGGGADAGWVTGPGSPRIRYWRSCTTEFSCKALCFLSRTWGEQPHFYIKKTPSSFIRTHIWFSSILRHSNQLF